MSININLELINNKVKFVGTSNTNQNSPITIDYVAPIGDGQGYLGLELLVMSFAGCVSTAIVAMLRKMGKDISGYKVNAIGIRNENPLSLERVEYEIILNSKDTTYEELKQVVEKAEAISPVLIAIKNNVRVISKITIEG